MKITVQNNTLTLPDGRTFQCAVGKAGIAVKQGEGDNITPIGTWPVREGFYRADKMDTPETALPLTPINKNDIWIDQPDHALYNQLSQLPFEGSHENMWRDDNVYDVVVPLGYNDDPVEPYKGSAIFLHIAREGYTPTAGCVALNMDDMIEVLQVMDLDTIFEIKP